MSSFRRTLLLVAALVVSTSTLLAQTTGEIVGHVTDASKAPLAGVVVEAKSPSLQGSRSTTTDSSGRYRLTLLPPGEYSVTFTLQNFAPTGQKGVAVSLDKETTLDLAMPAALREEITVTAPVIDTTTTSLGLNLSAKSIQSLPVDRTYSSSVQFAPGISTDAVSPFTAADTLAPTVTSYGSTGAENAYLIDGVNTTNIEYGFQGKDLNMEFIQEIDVKTGGYEAEYGRATGAIINVITKSGGNEFHGDVFGYLDNDSLQADADPVVSTGGTTQGFTRDDFGADLGGYFVKDKVWFFVAYDRVSRTIKNELSAVDSTGTPIVIRTESDSTRDLGSAKLTFRLTPNHSLIASFFQDPRDDTGAIVDGEHALNGEPLTFQGARSFGGRDWALRYEGIFGSNWILSAQIARHEEENSVGPATSAGDIIEFRDQDNNFFQTGGFGLIQEKTFNRDFAGISSTHYLGRHEVKFGAEYEKEQAEVTKRYSGGQRVDFFDNPNLLSTEPTIYVHRYWTTPDATVGNAPISALLASPEHKITTLYAQDSWSILSNLVINFGIRWDRQQIIDAAGTLQIDLNKDYAPRIGFVWDPTDQHKSKLFGSYGRYYEQLPMDLVIRSFSFERQPRIVNFSPTDTTPDPQAEDDAIPDDGDPSTPDTLPSAILGGFTEPSDPNIRGQYINEYILGYEREVQRDLALGVKGIYRDYGNVIEDFLCLSDGTYCIGNPAKGIMTEIFTLDYSTTFPAPAPERKYKGIQVDVTKRFSNNWQGIASYIFSKLEGNYDGEYAPFTNVGADPNISAAYDYYDFFTNGSDLTTITNHGPLSNDRRHQFKASGVYVTPINLSIGLSTYFRTGTPVTRYGYSDAYGRYEFFLTPRGAEGRSPSTYEIDAHLGYPLPVGKATINFMLDIFSLLDAQRAVLLDQRWGFTEADNASPTPVNPDYKKAVLRTPPRTIRVGMRLSF